CKTARCITTPWPS
ncbi:electron transfer flavoprotein beta-subunit, partial [Pseudomonas fluorescens WH6]